MIREWIEALAMQVTQLSIWIIGCFVAWPCIKVLIAWSLE